MDKLLSLRFNGDDFLNFVSFVKVMMSRSRENSKLVLMHVEDKSLVCRAISDTSCYIEYKVELYNAEDDDIYTEPFAVSISDLAALIKCPNSEESFAIRHRFGQFEFNVIGDGWLPFSILEVDESKFKIDGFESSLGKVNSLTLKNVISYMSNYASEKGYLTDKYLKFQNDRVVATSRLSSVVTVGEFTEMVLHRDSAALLKLLLRDSFDLSVNKLEGAVERLAFIGPKFKLIIVAADVKQVNVKYNEDITDYLTVSCEELYKMASFAEEYSKSKKQIEISVENGRLRVSVANNISRHSSKINSTMTGHVNDTTVKATIASSNIMKAIKLFQDKHITEVNIYITDQMLSSQNSILLFDGNTQAKVSQYNQ